jgi:hypothetical protein
VAISSACNPDLDALIAELGAALSPSARDAFELAARDVLQAAGCSGIGRDIVCFVTCSVGIGTRLPMMYGRTARVTSDHPSSPMVRRSTRIAFPALDRRRASAPAADQHGAHPRRDRPHPQRAETELKGRAKGAVGTPHGRE